MRLFSAIRSVRKSHQREAHRQLSTRKTPLSPSLSLSLSIPVSSFPAKNSMVSLNDSALKGLTSCIRLISRKLRSGTYNSHGRALDNCGFTYAARRAYYLDDPGGGGYTYPSWIAARNDTTRFSNWISGRFPFRGTDEGNWLTPYRA